MSKLPFELINLSKELQLSSVPYSGWPPPLTLSSSQVHSKDISPTTDKQSANSTPLVIDEIQHQRKLSTENNGKSYFEKLRSVAQNRRNDELKSHLNQVDNALENLIGSIQPSDTWNSDDTKGNKTQMDIVLSQLETLKQIYIDKIMKKSIQTEELERNVQHRYIFPIITPDGNVLFDFSKQSITDDIYLQLMQLVRLSNLDKLIQKIFHKSGEYHHVDYRENRRNQLEKDQENHQHQLSNNNDLLKLYETDKTNSYLTMAKAVHFRTSSHCFVLDGIDISSRFQHDRNIIRATCYRYIDTDSSTTQKEHSDSPHSMSSSHYPAHSASTNRTILVLCTQRMRKVYRLLESLLKSYITPNISIIYITFDQIEPFLTRYEQTSRESPPKDVLESFDFQNTPSTTMPIENNILNQSLILLQPVEFKEELNDGTKVNDKNIPKMIDLSNEELLLDYLRTSSLVLIFMKHLDETYLTTFIRWYTEGLVKCDLEHFWFITSDYQRAETVFNIPKTNLFLWPTDHNDFDHMSIIISSILILPIALSINYEIYSMLIEGLSIVDKHCRETTIDRNVCIQMALLRIWLSICERKTTAIITCDDDLQSFSEYAQTLLTEYDDINKHKMTSRYASIHGLNIFLQQQNHFSYDLIAIGEASQKPHLSESLTISAGLYGIENTFQDNQISYPHTFILLDQLTPLTLGIVLSKLNQNPLSTVSRRSHWCLSNVYIFRKYYF